VDGWCRAIAVDAGNGVHRTGSALRSGCVLGSWHRSIDREPHSADRRAARPSDAWRRDYWWGYAVAVFRSACLCDSRAASQRRRGSHLDDVEAWRKKTGIPFVPDAAWKDAVFAAAILFAVMACAFFFGPFGPGGMPDPTIIQTAPKPDYFFLWIYAVLAFLPPSIETPFMLVVPIIGIAGILLLPLFAAEGERHWAKRPVAVLMVSVIAVTLGIFTHLGTYTPWSPIMGSWTADTIPVKYLHDRSPLERQGALVLQDKQCRNCHSLDSVGGQRGPALDDVASRLTEDQIIRQVLQGGGNMPAYGNALNPSETKALMEFLMTLRGDKLSPAVDSSRALTHTSQMQMPQLQPQPAGKSQ